MIHHPPAETLQTEDAWQAHRALILAERDNPSLRDNPVWKCLRMDAYEALHRELTGVPK